MNKLLDFSRRSFLKAGSAIAGATALVGCSSSSDDSYYPDEPKYVETKRNCACFNNCSNGCRLYAHVRNNRLVKMSMAPMFPDERYNRACLRGLSQMTRIYGTRRVLYPMKRVSAERGDLSGFKRVSWEEAMSDISAKFHEIMTRDGLNGSKSIAYHLGSGTFASVNGSYGSYYQKLFTKIGASYITSSLDQNTAQGYVKAYGPAPVWVSGIGNQHSDVANSDVIFMWGTNPGSAVMQVWHHFAEARDRGATLVSIDIMMSGGAARADRFVNIRPGTDILLALSMIKRVIEQGWYNEEYMFKNTTAHFLVITDPSHPNYMKMLRGTDLGVSNGGSTFYAMTKGGAHTATTVNAALLGKSVIPGVYSDYELSGQYTVGGIQVKTVFQLISEHVDAGNPSGAYDATITKGLTGVHEDVTYDLTKLYVGDNPAVKRNRSVIICGFGEDHHSNGHHIYFAKAILAAITGNVGKPGTGIGGTGIMSPYINHAGISGGQYYPSYIPFPVLLDVFNGEGRTTDITSVKHYNNNVPLVAPMGGPEEKIFGLGNKIRAYFLTAGNPVTNYCETSGLIGPNGFLTKKENGKYKLELVVVADTEFTDTTAYADYILPVCHWFEREDTNGFGSTPMMLYQEKIFEPTGESLPDTEIARKLAVAMGYGDEFNMTPKELFDAAHNEEYYKTWFQSRTGRMPTDEETLTPDKIRERKVMRILPSMDVNGKKESIYPMCRDDSGAEPDLKIDTLETGRLQIFCESPGSASISGFGANIDGDTGRVATYERLPVFEPPYETWDAAWSATSALYPNTAGTDAEHTRNSMVTDSYLDSHPFHNFSQRIRWRVHTQWHYIPWIRELEPQPVVYLSPTDAARVVNGPVTTGDVVEIYNDRGAYRAKAIISPGLRPGIIDAPRGWQRWQYDQFYGESAGYALNSGAKDAGSCNDVTSRRVHVFSGCQAFFDARVNIRKITKTA